MLCEYCNEQEAVVHLTQVVEGAVKKLHLCEECAAEHGLDVEEPMSITDLVLGMGGDQKDVEAEPGERSCPRCHMRRSDFKKSGRFGCPHCYETFAEALPDMLRAVHHSEQHVGKVPHHEGARLKVRSELDELERALAEAVSAEEFESAAQLRDTLRRRREELGAQAHGETT